MVLPHRSGLLALALIGAAGTSPAQSSEPTPEVPARTLTPVTVVDPSAVPEIPDAAEPRVLVDADLGEGRSVPVELDDSIPLPVAPVFTPGEDGDTVAEEASGDPYFLGFIGGSHYPPENELVDPLLEAAAGRLTGGRPDETTYAFVMFSKRITPERRAALEDLGCRVLGFHPHYTMRVAVPVGAIGEVSVLDFVRWIGVARPEQKIHPATRSSLRENPAGVRSMLYVSTFEGDDMSAATRTPVGSATVVNADGTELPMDDARTTLVRPNGWMQLELERVGVEVVSYAERQATFAVLAGEEHLEALVALDFVQFVEPRPEEQLASAPAAPHDESRPMVSSDRLSASVDGSTNFNVVMGIVDSGVETAHTDLNINGFGWDCSSLGDPWSDASNSGSGHGTHVAGTILGRGVTQADQRGIATGLGDSGQNRLFNYRLFPSPCSVGLDSIVSTFSNQYSDGAGNVTRKPHIVNNSWGSFYTDGTIASGTEFNARVVDDAVFDEDQLWVWAAGNEGSGASTLRIEPSAKNSFTVGNVVDYIDAGVGDPGSLWTSSSRGPTSDNRWKPNVTAPGRRIMSCLANNNTGYAGYSGTSMASPHVAGSAALLLDQFSTLRDAPEKAQALLMASAMTDGAVNITTEASTHLDTFGAGRIDVYKATYGFGGNTWSMWSGQGSGSSWYYADFTAPAGCTRIVAVMTTLESSASAGASQALVNDWNFYLDRDPIDPAGNTGDYSAHQSSVDNSEIRTISGSNLEGLWRWKVYPSSVTSTTKYGVVVYFVVGDTTPDATLTLTASDTYIKPNEPVDVTATVDVADTVASSVVLDRSGSLVFVAGATTTLGDGTVTDLTDNPSNGADLLLGNIAESFDRSGTWTLMYGTEGSKTVSVNARSDNMVDKNASIPIVVDGTEPGTVGNLLSSSHSIGVWSNDPTITYTWTAALDNLSGIDGYGIFETSSASIPGTILDIGAVTSYTSAAFPSSTTPRYFNIRSVDRSGNWDSQFVTTGPYFVDVTLPGLPSYSSSSHGIGASRCDSKVTVTWNAATDGHSGVQGYGLFWTTSPTASPSNTLDTASTSDTQTLPAGTWYLNVKSVDNAGNWSSGFASFGPFIVSDECGTGYCINPPNSSGNRALITATGSDTAADNDLSITVDGLPANKPVLLFTGSNTASISNPGGSLGSLCIAPSTIGRISVKSSGAAGVAVFPVDLTSIPNGSGGFISVLPGQTRFWQAWHRDSGAFGPANFSSAVGITFH